MAETGSLPSPTSDKINRKPSSYPRLFPGLTTLKGFTETEVYVMSPTSILDTSKPFSVLKNPFWSDQLSATQQHSPKTQFKGGIGGCLGIVDVLNDHEAENQDPGREPKPETRMVLFGSQLKIQIPPLVVPSPQDSPKSPAEFGIKTRNQLGTVDSSFSSVLTPNNSSSPQIFSATEMELSEDYTCVISHGPNPKTTHIFDNCIVESCCGVVGFSSLRDKESNGIMANTIDDQLISHSPETESSFLSFCHNCKKNLGPGKDIYMYRGEKAFCSHECRFQEMMLEEGDNKMEQPDEVHGTCS